MGERAGPRSLRQLLDAVSTVGSDLDVPSMLRRIIESAVALVDASYGVLDESGTRLAQFITVGIDDETSDSIGHVPQGHGILGLRDEVFGNLYLTDKSSDEVFSDVDEELVVGLAVAAGVAIDNARLLARVHELAVLEDRERIARDLHDTMIQRLFTIKQIRMAIVDLERRETPPTGCAAGSSVSSTSRSEGSVSNRGSCSMARSTPQPANTWRRSWSPPCVRR